MSKSFCFLVIKSIFINNNPYSMVGGTLIGNIKPGKKSKVNGGKPLKVDEAALLFTECGTFGLRYSPQSRLKLARRSVAVTTEYGLVNVKVGEWQGKVVGVHPEFRKNGLARALYERFFAAARKLGCRTVRCVTSPVNKGSIAFHRRMGFSVEDSDQIVDGIPVVEGYDGKGEGRVLFYKFLDIGNR